MFNQPDAHSQLHNVQASFDPSRYDEVDPGGIDEYGGFRNYSAPADYSGSGYGGGDPLAEIAHRDATYNHHAVSDVDPMLHLHSSDPSGRAGGSHGGYSPSVYQDETSPRRGRRRGHIRRVCRIKLLY